MQVMLLPVTLPSSPSGPTVGAASRSTEVIKEGEEEEESLW
jgi:hypothetical protein